MKTEMTEERVGCPLGSVMEETFSLAPWDVGKRKLSLGYHPLLFPGLSTSRPSLLLGNPKVIAKRK